MKVFLATMLLIAGVSFAQAPASPPPVKGEPKTTATGLEYWEVKEGTGAEAICGKTVTVHYTGWIDATGKKFESSLDDGGKPFSFRVCGDQVIPGWDEGVRGMKVGGQRRLRIPAELAYGSKGSGKDIPPNATLLFDIELLRAK